MMSSAPGKKAPQHIQELMGVAVEPTGTDSPDWAALFSTQRVMPICDMPSMSVHTGLSQPQRCNQCKRPRDNNHPTLCPICHLHRSERQAS